MGERFAKSRYMVSDADDNPDSHQNLITYLLAHLECALKFAWKFILWYLRQVDKLTSKKYAKTINPFCAGIKDFVKYQAEGGF